MHSVESKHSMVMHTKAEHTKAEHIKAEHTMAKQIEAILDSGVALRPYKEVLLVQ